ncbi:MAG: mannose-6-phosphate isomerase [Bacteroidales bacterium]|nr:mannose-6-phosphate isomerase [Bacteroidales bacterium]
MNELYPIKFKPILKDRIWGGNKLKALLKKNGKCENCGESWELSAVDGDVSVVSNGFLKGNTLQEVIEVYMGDLLGDTVYEKYGLEFPLLVKFIDAADDLSIQVHPDDKLAAERHDSFGKTEMWVVMQAERGANLIAGFSKKVTKEEYLQNLEKKTLKDILNAEEVQEGDVFFIPAGRVHAIGAGILLAEIQQTSDVTYRIYDWDRTDASGKSRELHTEQALDAIDYSVYPEYKTKYTNSLNQTVNVADCPYFTTNVMWFDTLVIKDYNFIDSFVIYICMKGSVVINAGNGKTEKLKTGETILIPASLKELEIIPVEESKILEVYIKN